MSAKLWKCSICGRVDLWSASWGTYTSLAIDDDCPQLRIVTCSDSCHSFADKKMVTGEIALPTVRIYGGMSTMSKPQKGYAAQPDQAKLLREWNEQRARHPPVSADTHVVESPKAESRKCVTHHHACDCRETFVRNALKAIMRDTAIAENELRRMKAHATACDAYTQLFGRTQ